MMVVVIIMMIMMMIIYDHGDDKDTDNDVLLIKHIFMYFNRDGELRRAKPPTGSILMNMVNQLNLAKTTTTVDMKRNVKPI